MFVLRALARRWRGVWKEGRSAGAKGRADWVWRVGVMTEWQALASIGENVSGAIGAIGVAWAIAWFLVKTQ
ncbi:hypothetical protein [Komagataeibacter phage phiKX1]|nr:hypothetical protein [Komagataeibacter phage phiKX1]BCZ76116.1 hypothetical protein [Komagataeibacter phage phiKX2]